MEPLGIQDMRFAKAEYIRALKDLRAADAEYVRAQAAFELARARYKDAQTANLNADTEYQKLLNEYQQLINEARQDTNDFIAAKTASAIDSIKKEIELRELTHAKAMVDAEKDLAYAREQLRVALRNIALYSQSLTPAEQSALAAAVYMYETAFEETADQTIVVLQAQRTLDSLKLVREVGPDTAYDKSSKAYIGAVEKWNKDIEKAQVEQALVAALLLAVPDSLVYDDVDGWKEQIDELVKDSTELAYNQYQVKEEMANYYTANIHDGVKYFNTVASEWKNDHEAVADPGAEPKKDAAKYIDHSDTIKVLMKRGDIQKTSWSKFVYLLGSYDGVVFPASKNDPKNNIMTFSATGDTVTVIANQALREYVMGAAGNDSLSQKAPAKYDSLKTANYGLEGAYDILARELVISDKKAATPEEIEEALENLDKKDSIWSAHRQILIDGIANYVPFEEAEAILEFEEEENGEGAKKMVEAVKTLQKAFVDTKTAFASFDGNDSLMLFNALVNFAQAREDYLNYTAPKEIDLPAKRDSNVFYYSIGKSGSGKAIVASQKFSELTYEELKAGDYEYLYSDPGDVKPFASVAPDKDSAVNAFVNIIDQLLGSDFVDAFKKTSTPGANDGYVDAVSPNDMSKALYNTYKIDDWANPTKILKGSEVYTPEELLAAKENVVAKINEFIDVYNAFWFSTSPVAHVDETTPAVKAYLDEMDKPDTDPDKDVAKKRTELIAAVNALFNSNYNPECYTLATFKPFNEEAPIVKFVSGSIMATTDLSAVLVAVDPNSKGETNQNYWKENPIATGSAILGTNTDFYNLMKAYDEYYSLIIKDASADLADIRAQIDAVIAAFDKDAAREGAFKAEEYETDHSKWEKNKPKYDKYLAALQEFAGPKAKKESDIVTFTMPTVAPTDFASIDQVLIGGAVEPETAFGYYPGEWNKKLGGKQLELAKEIFPDYPEELAAWDAEIKIVNDNLKHYEILIKAAKDAYFASAKIAGENVDDAANWDELVENYKAANKRYRERLIGIIEDLQADIETLEERIAKFNQGIPQLDIAIAEAEKDLKVESARLKGYEEALAYAKANLDHLLEYIKSLDVNFVVPAVDLDD